MTAGNESRGGYLLRFRMSQTGGVKPFSIQGRLYRERERLSNGGMTDAERAWRAQWVKDQNLSHHEPRHVPEIRNELYNPIRRAYMKPLDMLFKPLEPTLGKETAMVARKITGKLCMVIALVYAGAYYFKYNQNDWTRKGGWRVLTGRIARVPGEIGFGEPSDRLSASDYAPRGFKNSPI